MEANGKPSRRTFRVRLDEMVSALRDDIMTGKLGPGSFLPSEEQLVEQFTLSNKSVRKGLDVLVAEGLIEKLPRVGTVVSSRKITITLGCRSTIYKDAELGHIIAEFHKLYPHIQVQILTLSFDRYFGTIKEYLENGMMDVVLMNRSNLDDFIEQDSLGLLEPLSPRKDLYPFLTKGFSHENRLYAQPFIFSPVVLCYNKQHLAEANVQEPDSSWTWEELLEQANALHKANERCGFYFHLLSDNRWPIFLLQNGVYFDEVPSERAKIIRTKLKDSLAFCKSLHDLFPASLSEGDSDTDRLFAQEKASMIMTTYISLNRLKHMDIRYDIAPLPYLKYPKSLLLMMGLAVNKNAKEKEAAQSFVEFLVSHKAQSMVKRETLCIPALKAAAEAEEEGQLNRPSRFAMFREIIPSFGLYSDLNLSYHGIRNIREQMKLYLSGMDDVDTLCERIEHELLTPQLK